MSNYLTNKNFKEKVQELVKELSKIAKDPKTKKEREKFHKKLSYLSPKDLLKQFTI